MNFFTVSLSRAFISARVASDFSSPSLTAIIFAYVVAASDFESSIASASLTFNPASIA